MAEIQGWNSAQKVFFLPELVEQIQSHLPLRDLLLSQRICTKFHDVFHARPKFKQQLHLAPGESLEFKIAPLLPSFIVKALDVRSDPKQPPGSLAELSMCVKPDIKDGSNCSWRDISITSPPATDALVYVLGWSPFYPHLFAMQRIRNKDGVTLGQIADATVEYRKNKIRYWYHIRAIRSVRRLESIV